MNVDTDETRPIFADERQAHIAELVAVRGRVRVAELVEMFDVSEPTLRKDLSALQERGLLKRTHGGAVSLRPLVDRGLEARITINLDAKRAIAQACLDYIAEGDSIFLDSGSTVLELARLLASTDPLAPRRFRSLTVLTNGLGVAEALSKTSGVEHILLGGSIRPTMGALVGTLAIQNLQRFSVGPAFLGISGLSEAGISVGDLAEAEIKENVLDRARRVIVPIDSSKVGVTDFARVGGLEDVDVVVTETSTEELEQLCAAFNIELRVARPDVTR